jgi:hypothetical protein
MTHKGDAHNMRIFRLNLGSLPMGLPTSSSAPADYPADYGREDYCISEHEFTRAVAAVRQASATRPERIAALRERVEANTYYVPDILLAEKILDFQG